MKLTNNQTGKVTGTTFEQMHTASEKRGSQTITLIDEKGDTQEINLYAIEKSGKGSFMGNFNNTTVVDVDFTDRETPTFTTHCSYTVSHEPTKEELAERLIG